MPSWKPAKFHCFTVRHIESTFLWHISGVNNTLYCVKEAKRPHAGTTALKPISKNT
ncbi:UNVERIFIED_CONTAM: hypothetical protein FKN15_060875 [Acipenser sinensis]